MLQQNSYNNKNAYYKFLKDYLKMNYLMPLLRVVLVLLMLIIPCKSNFFFVLTFIYLIVLILNSIINYIKHNTKLPLKVTNRVKRILTIDYLLYIILQVISFHFDYTQVIIALMIYIIIHPLLLIFYIFLLKPVEKKINYGLKIIEY